MPDRNPFQGITDLFSELGRVREAGVFGRELGQEPRERTHASAWVPTTDIFLLGDRLVIRIELAGVDPENIDLRFANGVLTVSGTRTGEFDRTLSGTRTGEFGAHEPTFYVRERFLGEFRRSITLPEGTRREQIQAGFEDGLVEIVVEGVGKQEDSSRIQLRDRSGKATTRTLD
jgi:HSP20 family protein